MAPAQSAQVKVLEKKFKTASKIPTHLGLSDLSAYDQDGQEVSDINFPFQLRLDPNPALTGTTFEKVPSIPAGTKLYDVYAQANPDAPFNRIGAITTTSAFVVSTYGDEILFFQHQRFEEDLALRPEWAAVVDHRRLDEGCPFKH